MRLIDYTFDEPAHNLAFEEVLLDGVETGQCGEALRFWESRSFFVVLGVSQVLSQHVFEERCAADGVPVLRRCSAGGCVLQGPGSLNYTLALRAGNQPELSGIRSSYAFLLGRMSQALVPLGIHACHAGISDMASDGRKFSGNAQKRRRRAILHHGTLLWAMDGTLIERYLKEPEDRPDYRGERTHGHFVRPIKADGDALKNAIRAAFAPDAPQEQPTSEESTAVEELARTKYGNEEWTRRR